MPLALAQICTNLFLFMKLKLSSRSFFSPVAGDLLRLVDDGLFEPDCLVAREYDVFKTRHSAKRDWGFVWLNKTKTKKRNNTHQYPHAGVFLPKVTVCNRITSEKCRHVTLTWLA